MGLTYIVYYDFAITSGNHAGMSHLARLIGKERSEVRLIKSIPHQFRFGTAFALLYAISLAVYFKFKLKKEDQVFFFEYLTKGVAHQDLTARWMKRLRISNALLGLVHLSGNHLLEKYKTEEQIRIKLKPLSKVFVFGSSLERFLRRACYQKEIVTTFHYVDNHYYRPLPAKQVQTPELRVICMGGLKRNFRLLKTVIAAMPEVHFNILKGNYDLKTEFEDCRNVTLHGYLTEDVMRSLMQECDVSLSVMEDTVGSNVITSSMAVGLVQVVSDVGSIRDYCNEENSFLCKTTADFIDDAFFAQEIY